MKEKGERRDIFWYPSEFGSRFLGGLGMFDMKLADLDNKQFPCYYMEISFFQYEPSSFEPKRIAAKNELEYLKLMLGNLFKFKQWAEKYHDEIFSE